MAQDEIDAYLAALEEPKRSTLEKLRTVILEVVPDAEQGLAYGAPAFKVRGKTVAGFAAFKNHFELPATQRVRAGGARRCRGPLRDVQGIVEVRHRPTPLEAARCATLIAARMPRTGNVLGPPVSAKSVAGR